MEAGFGGAVLDIVGTQSLVLALLGSVRLKEEALAAY